MANYGRISRDSVRAAASR